MLLSRSVAGCSVAVLVAIFALRCYLTYPVFNDTKDEAVHIAAGLEIWHNGRYTIDRQHPPLARMAIGLGARLGRLPYGNPGALWATSNVDAYWRTLKAARMVNLIFVLPLFLGGYLWGKRLYGPAAGLAATALASMCPNLLAHAAVATVDFGAVATSSIAAFYFWKWSREPGTRSSVQSAVTFGLAVLTKFSALIFVPA